MVEALRGAEDEDPIREPSDDVGIGVTDVFALVETLAETIHRVGGLLGQSLMNVIREHLTVGYRAHSRRFTDSTGDILWDADSAISLVGGGRVGRHRK